MWQDIRYALRDAHGAEAVITLPATR